MTFAFRLICLGCTTTTQGERTTEYPLALFPCECGGRRYRLELLAPGRVGVVEEVTVSAAPAKH